MYVLLVMLFKISYILTENSKPHEVQVDVPVSRHNFEWYTFTFSRIEDAMCLMHDYAYTHHKNPESILEFHKEKVHEIEHNLTLPFFNN